MTQTKNRSSWLKPLSALYGAGVRLRSFLFDHEIFSQTEFPIPVICIGNLAVGGTGKTPHIEFLIHLFDGQERLAVVSRGYKRKSKGLVRASLQSSAAEIGDEPRQILQKFPHITMVIDADRCRAIRYLSALPEAERPTVILMDDGFQHRYVKPSFSILLTDYHNLYVHDALMPMGRLRENIEAAARADCVIVSRTPREITPIRQRIVERDLDLYPHQELFFSRMIYNDPKPVFPESASEKTLPPQSRAVLAICGIANPQPFLNAIKGHFPMLEALTFPDHHAFKSKDIELINRTFGAFIGRAQADRFPVAICTEKDAQRLADVADRLSPILKRKIYTLPISVEIRFAREAEFKRVIFTAIADKRNRNRSPASCNDPKREL